MKILHNGIEKDSSDILSKWDLRFYELAKFISRWSKDPNTAVGAVAVKGKRQIGWGINGLPSKIKDDERLLDREWKRSVILHAEDNLLLHSNDLAGATIYLFPLPSCSQCTSKLIEAGIIRVVCRKNTIDRWEENIKLSIQLYKEANIEVIEIED